AEPVVAHALERDTPPEALTLLAGLVGFCRPRPLIAELPVESAVEGMFLLPWLSMVLDAQGGPVSVLSTGSGTVLTWTDGYQVTTPTRDAHRTIARSPRVKVLPRVQQLTVLNGAPGFAGIARASRAVDADVLAALEEGLYLLRDVWPEAHDASQRLLRSVVVLEHSSDLVLSFTDGRWLGVLFASCREAFQVAGSIVHETAHARLAPLLSLGPLLLGDDAS